MERAPLTAPECETTQDQREALTWGLGVGRVGLEPTTNGLKVLAGVGRVMWIDAAVSETTWSDRLPSAT